MSALIQSVVNQAYTGTTVTGTFTSNVTAGSTLVVCTSGPSGSTVTDSLGNSYTVIALGANIWYSVNALGGANVVTVTYPSATGYQNVIAQEYTKASSGAGYDTDSYTSATSSTPTSASTTSSVANDLVVSFVTGGGSPTAGTSATLVDNSTGDGVQYQVVASAGSFTANMVLSSSGTWYYLLAAFKPSGTTYTKSVSDSATLAELLTRGTSKALSTPFSLADLFSRATSKVLSATFTLSETLTALRTAYASFTDSFSLSDSINALKTHVGNFADSFSLSDTNVLKFVFKTAGNDVLSIVDSVTAFRNRVAALVDSISVSDVWSSTKAFVRGYIDFVSVSDSVSKLVNHIQSDGLAISETFNQIRSRVAAFVDSFSVTELLTKLALPNYVDTVSVSDVITKLVKHVQADVLAVTETFNQFRSRVAAFASSISLTESLSHFPTRAANLFDSVVPYDTISRAISKSWLEVVSIAEHFNQFRSRFASFAESFSIVEMYSAASLYIRNYVESFSLAESFAASKVSLYALADSIFLSDGGIVRSTGKLFSEVVSVSESTFTKIRSRVASLVDNVSVVEIIFKNVSRNFLESISLSEIAAYVRSRIANLVDTVPISETVSKMTNKFYQTAFAVSDSINKQTSRTFTELTIAVSETFARATGRALRVVDSLSLADVTSFVRARVATFVDSLPLLDRCNKSIARTFSEIAITISDAVSTVIPRLLKIWGLLALSSPYQQRNLNVSDNVGPIRDSLRPNFFTRFIRFVDGLAMRDAFSFTAVYIVDAIRSFVVDTWNRLWHVIPQTRSWTAEQLIRNWSATENMLNTSKFPDANEAFSFDWSTIVLADTIVSSSWSADSGVVLSDAQFTATSTTVRVGGGVIDHIYNVYNKVTLLSGQVKVQGLAVTISNA